MSEPQSIAVKCFMAGNLAVEKGNFDYAIKMYATSAKVDPASLVYRQALRAAQHKLYADNGTGASMGKMQIMALKPRLSKARRNKDWKGLNEAAEEALAINPWDIQSNTDLGDACRELDYDEVAIFAYEQVLKKDSENLYANEAMAAMLARVFDDPAQRMAMGRANREKAERDFAQEGMFSAWWGLLSGEEGGISR